MIIAIECSVVAILYEPKVKRIRICLITFVEKSNADSLSGFLNVFLRVGIKAIRSMATTIITDIVGSFVSIQGIRPRRAKAKKNLSDFGGFLKPYLREKRNIITVKTSEAAVGIAPIPAPFAT